MATVHHPTQRITATSPPTEKSLTQIVTESCKDPILRKIERRERLRMSLCFILPMIIVAGAIVISQL